MSFSASQCAWYKVGVYTFFGLILLLSGCSSMQAQLDSVVAPDDDDSAELAELFEDIETSSSPSETKQRRVDELVVAEPVSDLGDGAADFSSIIGEIESSLEGPANELGIVEPEPLVSSSVSVFDWQVVTGGIDGNAFFGRTQIQFQRPVALSAKGAFVYVVDAGLAAVLRYDRVTRRLAVVLHLDGKVAGEVADIYVLPDHSFLITDTDASRVLLYSRDGKLLKVFENRLNLAKPVSVTVLDDGHVVVADGYYDHLVRFNTAGEMVATYSARGLSPGDFLNMTTMSRGPDGYYVGSRVGRKVQIISDQGEYRYSFEEGYTVFPSAIVVDDSNRSYVADFMDDVIKIYDRGQLVSSIGGHGTAPGRFKRIEDLWLDGPFLYVADSLNSRIQIARISPEFNIFSISP